MLSLLAGRKFCKCQTDWPLGSHQSWAWNCWIWICRKKHAVAPLQVHDVWSTKSAECSLKSFHRFQLTGPSWKHSNRKCCLYNLQVNLQVYTYGCLKFILYSISIYIILIIYYTTRPFDQKPILLKQTQQQTHQPTTFFTTLHHLRGNPSTPLPSSSSLGRSNSSAAIQLFPGYLIAWAPFKWWSWNRWFGFRFTSSPTKFFTANEHPWKPWMVGVGRRLTVCLFGFGRAIFRGALWKTSRE